MTYEERLNQAIIDYRIIFDKENPMSQFKRVEGFIAGAKWASENWEWISVADGPPKDIDENSIPCLTYDKGYIHLRYYNQYHGCWDDGSSDDYECDFDQVEKYIVIKL